SRPSRRMRRRRRSARIGYGGAGAASVVCASSDHGSLGRAMHSMIDGNQGLMATKSNCYLTRPGGEKQGICMAGAGGLHFLTAVEQTIIDAACAGKPAQATGEVRVDLIRFLACGGDAACPVAPRGLEIHDAVVI